MSGAALGSDRLSVRSGPNRQIAKPRSGQTAFAESLDFEKLALLSEPTYRNVAEGTSRRLETVYDGIDALEEYIDNKKDAVLALEEIESGDVMTLPYNHRWTEDYRDMVYAKLKAAEEELERLFGPGPTPVTLLSLTAHQTDAEGRPRPPGDVLDDLLDGWDRFRRVIRRATEGWKTEYIRIVEPHQSGYPHLHIAIFGRADPSMAEKVQELWVEKYGIGGADAHSPEKAVTVARGRSAQLQNVAAYMMKYLSKTTVRATGEQQQVEGFQAFSALLWATGRRQFSASEGLTAAMKRETPEAPGRWRFVGVGYGIAPGLYEGEDAADLLDHLTGSVWKPPPACSVAGRVVHGSLSQP